MIIGTDRISQDGVELLFADMVAAANGVPTGVTAGTVAVGKPVVPTTGKVIDTIDITTPKIGGVTLTATAAELNAHHLELTSITTLATTAAGTVDAVLTFKDAAGTALARVDAGMLYLSTSSTGLTANAATSLAATVGALTELVTGKIAQYITTAAGALTVRVVGAGTWYICIRKPNGGIIVSGAIVIS